MRINNNIPALQSYTALLTSNRNVDRSVIRLSSGIRINSVKDDAAGMAISNKLKFQVSGIEVAGRNTMDGISVVQVAEGALQEIHNMLQRVRELAVQSSNDTNTAEDRWKMDDEARQLVNEISNVAKNTEFNKMKLLFGDAARMAKVPEDDKPYVDITYTADAVPNDVLSYQVDAFGLPANVSTGGSDLTNIAAAVGLSVTIGRDSFSIQDGDTPQILMKKFQDLLYTNDLLYSPLNGADENDYMNGAGDIIIYSKEAGSHYHVEIKGDAAALAVFGLTAGDTYGTDAELDAGSLTVGGESYAYIATGNHIEMESSGGKRITMELKINQQPDDDGDFTTLVGDKISAAGADPVFTGNAKDIEMLNFGMFQLQIGANKGQDLAMNIPAMTMEALQIKYLHLKCFEGAQKAITQADDAIQYVSDTRGRLGAYQNRLEHTHDSLGVTGENTADALSRIYDADMAKEISLYTKNNVIVQAGMAILAQANQRPQQILQLLG